MWDKIENIIKNLPDASRKYDLSPQADEKIQILLDEYVNCEQNVLRHFVRSCIYPFKYISAQVIKESSDSDRNLEKFKHIIDMSISNIKDEKYRE